MNEQEPRTDPAGETGGAPPAAPQRSLRRVAVAGGLLVGLGLWLVVALLPGFLSRPTAPATEPNRSAEIPVTRRVQATLYYVSDDGAELVPVVRDVPFGETPVEQARHIVNAQVAPAGSGLVSAIPIGTTVRALFLGPKGDAYVDLSPEVRSTHRGGSLDEALAVFAIVNAITSNLPDVTAVQLLIDGKEVDSLAGHIDLRQPLTRAAAWIRKGQ